MGLKAVFKQLMNQAVEGVRPPFYHAAQTYMVQYDAAVRNKLTASNSCTVILPVPLNASYQQLKREPRFFPDHWIMSEDRKFGNHYVYWQTEFAPGERKIFKEEFIVTVSPRKAFIDELPTLDDYHLTNSNFASGFVYLEDSRVKDICQRVVGNEKKISLVLRFLNEYVVSNLKYGNPISGLYPSSDTFEKEKVDCGGFDTLLVALCLAVGIPARIVSGFWAGYEENDMHAWVEIMLPNRDWVPADPSVEHLWRHGRTKKSGELGFVGSDRIAFSIGCEIPITAGDTAFCVDILQNPFVISDEPASFSLGASFSATIIDGKEI